MKKITLLLASISLCGLLSAQTVADFETGADYTISGWGYATDPAIADDGTGNMALTIEKDADATFDQGANIIFTSPVTPDAGNTRLIAQISGITGARGYIKVYQAGTETINSWWSKEDGSTLSADDTYEEYIVDGISGDAIDSIIIHLGGWDDGNAPTGLQGTYYIDDISLTTPPAVIVAPRKVVAIQQVNDADISIDGLPMEASWTAATSHEIANYDSASYSGSFKARFKALWSFDYLYLLLEADDATPTEYDGLVDTWKRDGFQGYWDVRNRLLEGRKDNATQHQLNFGYGNTQMDGWDGGAVDLVYNNDTNSMKTEWISQSKTGGYIVEARVPLAAMCYNGIDVNTWGLSVAAVVSAVNDTIGFDMQANDYNPGTDSRDAALVWSSYSTDTPGGYQNSGVWGGLLLSGYTSIENETAVQKLTFYPNPVENQIQIGLDNIQQVEIFNMMGTKVMDIHSNNLNSRINVEHLNSGIYILNVTKDDGKMAVGKFIKK